MDVVDFAYDIRVATFILGILVTGLLYWYSTRNHDYWKKRGIPCPKTYPLLGSLGEVFLGNSFEETELKRYKLGRIYGTFEGNKPVITVAEPEIIRNILVKDFQSFTNRRMFETGDPINDTMIQNARGEDWKRLRTIISPTFSTGKIKRVMSIFQDCARTVLQNVKTSSENGPVDMLKLYGAYTMDVIASAAFSTKIDSHNDPENNFVKKAKMAFSQRIGLRFILFFLFPFLLKKFKINVFSSESMDFFKSVTNQIIQERKKTGQTRNDFLQLLLDTANEVSKEEKWEENTEDVTANYGDDATNHSIFKGTSVSKHLSQDELVAQCVIFFLAGYHTTATTLSLTTHMLTVNQDAQEKLYKEIKDVLKETDGKLTYDSVQKMKYLDNIISETLRIYSPALRLERQAEETYKLGDTGLTIPKGMIVGIPIYAMHRDPTLFPDPEKFDPDRFSPQGKEKQIPYSYLPFGAGPRNCVGMRFALVELKVCLINVFATYHVQKCSETKVPPEFGKGLGLLTPKSVIVKMERRSYCPLKS